jgi:hypothetical protein
MLETKMHPLIIPAIREWAHKISKRHSLGLAAIQDGFDDVGRQLGHPDRFGNVAVIQHFTLGHRNSFLRPGC